MKQLLLVCFLLLLSIARSQSSFFVDTNFSKADSIATVYKGYSLKKIPQLTYRLTHHLEKDVEKFRAIFTWVSSNISCNNQFIRKVSRKRHKYRSDSLAFSNWNNSFNKKFFTELIENKSTVCSGYAYLVNEMALMAGIKTKIIDGYLKSSTYPFPEIDVPNHSWNAVQLDGKWFLCDATLASGYFYENIGTFVFDFKDGYFLASPEIFRRSHFPIEKHWNLLENTFTFDDFVDGPIIYSYAFTQHIVPISPKSIGVETVKNNKIEFLFQLFESKVKDTPNISMVSDGKELKPDIILEDDIVRVSYAFKNKGVYDVHFNINNNTFTSYTVKVSKI